MTTIAMNATYTLTAVIDLREWNECTESYDPVDTDKRIPCAHCGKKCQKVYEVTRNHDQQPFLIGPSCCKKNLFGWEPEKQAAREMEKAAEKLAKNKAYQKLVDLALPIAAQVASMSVPEIIPMGTKFGHPAYGMTGVSIVCREGLTPERRRVIEEGWKGQQVRALAASIEGDKKREKVCRLACGELLI